MCTQGEESQEMRRTAAPSIREHAYSWDEYPDIFPDTTFSSVALQALLTVQLHHDDLELDSIVRDTLYSDDKEA